MTVMQYDPEESQESVIDLVVQGLSATQISKDLSIPRKDVQSIIRQWHKSIADDSESRDVARDALNLMVSHYDKLIKKMYDLYNEVEMLAVTPSVANQRRGILDSIGALEAKRVDALQKAGLYDNNQMGDAVAKMEEEKAIILDILRNDLCGKCRPDVMQKIGQMTGRVEVVVVHDE